MPLTKAQRDHINHLSLEFTARMSEKYRKGAKEHGGDIFDLNEFVLLDEAIAEAIDQFVYLMTLRSKLTKRLVKR